MRRMLTASGVILGLVVCAVWGQNSTTHRNSFEVPKTFWLKASADAPYEVQAHISNDQGAHQGQRSEYLKFEAKEGRYIHYQYPVGKAPLTEELLGGLYLKSNRTNLQLLLRVVLPNEPDPANLQQKMTTLLRCDKYQNAGRWQYLDFGSPTKTAKDQQAILNKELGRSVNWAGAYVDSLFLNVYAGPGPTEVWIDDLEIMPVTQAGSVSVSDNTGKVVEVKPIPSVAKGKGMVDFTGNHLTVGGNRFFFRMIRHSDTPVSILKMAGFNTVLFQRYVAPDAIREASGHGMWIVPQLTALADDAKANSLENLNSEVNWYSEIDNTLFVHLGETLVHEQNAQVTRLTGALRRVDPGRAVSANVWDGLPNYSRTLNLVGMHRFPLMTTMELPKYREWLEKRRLLASPNVFMWTWIQTQLSDWHANLLYSQSANQQFLEPVGPQPEQIRLLTYTALAAGSRGLGFWSDRFLADTHHGRDRLLTCALLNQELEMLEPVLTQVEESPQWIDTTHKDVKAAVMRCDKSVLVLPMWLGKGAQFVPGQSAAAKLSLIVPQVPQSMQAWEVLPGEVRSLKIERVAGGSRITLPEFGVTTNVVFTSDLELVKRFQVHSHGQRQKAAQWTYDLAGYQYEKVLKIQEQLDKMGRSVPDAVQLLADTHKRLGTTQKYWENHQFAEAYREGQRALRPLRILMRAQWEEAVKELTSPVSSPYAVSYYTLPRHWNFADQVRGSREAGNLLATGDFESLSELPGQTWEVKEQALDDVMMSVLRVADIEQPMEIKKDGVPTSVGAPKQGKKCAMLQITPKKGAPAPQALERSVLSLRSPEVKLTPGSLVKISGWVRIPTAITATSDGALLYDSAGGEPLAIRLTEPTPWKEFIFFRRVPASGTISVTLALTGLGTAYFDDIQIHPLTPALAAVPVSQPKN